MSEEIKQIIEIHPDSKYIIIANQPLSIAAVEQLRDRFRKWQQSNDKFLVLSGDLTLQRMDE